jgi:hypothetical protein
MSGRFKLEDETKQEFIIEALKQARAEIDSRLQTNINLIRQSKSWLGKLFIVVFTNNYVQ